jgi:hypothetical protein
MNRALAIVAIATVLPALAGCADDETTAPPAIDACLLDPAEVETLGNGDHLIAVELSGGESDSVWIHVASPDGDGPFPVVVIGGDQSANSFANCRPAEVPGFDVQLGTDLASLGFLSIQVGFRNEGDAAPGVGTLRLRDHHMHDARAMLAAARWGRAKHGKGGAAIAMVGHGRGTWPAFWSVTPHPELQSLQECLDVKTLVLSGDSANHVSAAKGLDDRWQAAMGDAAVYLQVVTEIAALNLIDHTRAIGKPEVSYADATGGEIGVRLGSHLKGTGINLLRVMVFDPADTLVCNGLDDRPPSCDPSCVAATAVSQSWGTTEFSDLTYWFEQPTMNAIAWWSPPAQVEPTEQQTTGNPWLAAMVSGSPVYSAEGPLLTGRAIHLLAQSDSRFRPEAQSLLIDKLGALGAAAVEAPVITADFMGAVCGDADYFLVARPQCGWEQTIAELNSAFGL